MPTIYSAHWVLPIVSPPIEWGAVAIDGSQIVAVGSREEIALRWTDARVEDFGEAAVLPGLINTHSHLELTVMRGFLEAEEHDFFAWLKKLTIARMAMTDEDLFVSATCGAIEAARAGITCVGDSSSFATQSMKALQQLGLRGIVYQESFGPDPKLARENFEKLVEQVNSMRSLETNLVRAGVSPHAPYTVSAPQLELISEFAIDEKLPLMMHAAESKAESMFMLKGEGPFAEGLRKRGLEWRVPGVSTIQYLDRHGVMGTRPLLAHGINVDDADINLMKQRNAGVAHCPKSNAKLRHGRAPFARFVSHGLNVGLGSDSVASNNTCDMLEEARFATLLARVSEAGPSGRASNDIITPEDLGSILALPDGRASDTITATDALFAATLGGARALGLDNQIGALAVGLSADLTVIDLRGAHQQPSASPEDAIIFSSSGRDVICTMVAGKEVYRAGRGDAFGEPDFIQRLRTIRQKLDTVTSTT
ncbi:MAG TPA: amidohydrolase family protein [Pyrinomonadaceae bacterium]|nr:amidohydrolase family protein [Pyrinomonadaceae bacterium]